MKKIAACVALVAFAALATIAVGASEGIVKERRALMKDVVSENVKIVASMIRGTTPYEAAKAEAALKAVGDVPAKFVTMFPEGTSTADHPDSEAKPEIWNDKADFDSIADGLAKASLAAAAAAKDGPDTLKGAFIKVMQQCKACHEVYSEADY